jgi:hypothetical protein
MRVTNPKATLPPFLRIIVAVLGASVFLSCQTATNGQAPNVTKEKVISVPDLGFRYTPPADLLDKTTPESRQLRDRAASYSTKLVLPILDMSSNDTDTSPEWRQVLIAIFPRAQMPNVTDAVAERKVSAALAGPHSNPVGESQSTTIAGRSFLVSEFTQDEPPLLKHAKIYTTICKTQLVSFIFVSNSAAHVKAMEESVKSLDFFGH